MFSQFNETACARDDDARSRDKMFAFQKKKLNRKESLLGVSITNCKSAEEAVTAMGELHKFLCAGVQFLTVYQ